MNFYLVGLALAAKADAAREGILIRYLRDEDAAEPLQGGLPRLVTLEVGPEETGANGVRLDAASRAKLAAAGADPDEVQRELHEMKCGDRKMLADVVFGAKGGAPEPGVAEQVRWFGVAPTEEKEERIARGETVTFLIDE